MAFVVNRTMPEGVTIQMSKEVAVELGDTTDPPAGMIVHTGYAYADGT